MVDDKPTAGSADLGQMSKQDLEYLNEVTCICRLWTIIIIISCIYMHAVLSYS